MTEQEQQLISGLAERVKNAPAQQMDRDADNLIRTTIGSRPDALYILTQTVLVQEMAINQAKAQIDDLKQKLADAQQAPASSGFLRSTAPQGDWGHEGRVQQGAPAYQQPPYQQPPYQQPAYAPPPQQGGGFGSFLRNAATTAAGVVAGEIAFSSLTSLFGHQGGFFGGGGGGMFGGGGISPGSETIINNYYGDEHGGTGAPGLGGGDDSQFASAARDSGQDVSSDIDDERDASGSGFVGGDDDNSGDQSDAFDDSSSSDDDAGGFDDGGGSDDGGGF